ncbi:hypothetical protein HK413_05050 [Mucilaginibacter sp. S1162]|uniref:Uncharacterized protein n=1 Tax=Mucilaginibacter humi TaxID=2732510 RepID=A0ABX1W0D1_9SPHI|nr:hypothetical protein [Mucilaginibacter humi]NNU33671.1 hypothetical protein [Mucilaginibacter humi]
MRYSPILTIAASLLIFLFVYAALSKLADFSLFKAELARQVLPVPMKAILAGRCRKRNC